MISTLTISNIVLSESGHNYMCLFPVIPGNDYYTNWLTFGVNLVNVVSLVVTSVWIIHYTMTRERPNQQGMSSNERRLIHSTIMICCNNAICCVTIITIQVLASYMNINIYLMYITIIPMTLNSLVNPILLTFIKRIFIKSLTCSHHS